MADLTFQQTQRRSPLTIILPAIAALIAVSALIYFVLHRDKAQGTFHAAVTGTQLLPIHTKYAHVFGTPGPDETQDTLYILARIKLDNPSKTPLFIKDFTATYLAPGSEPTTNSAVQKNDVSRLVNGFVGMKALADKLGCKPLLRETEVAAGATAEGYIIVQFPITPEEWSKRQSGMVNIAFYHQDELALTIPK